MAIANPVLTTAVTLGATTTSLTKVKDGLYSYVNPTGNVPNTLTIKAAALGSARTTIGLTFKRNPGLYDAPSSTKSGFMTGSFTLSFLKGSAVSVANIEAFALEIGSLLATPALIQALLAGSLE